jgi:hypothetical protein
LEAGAFGRPKIRTDAAKASAKLPPRRVECNVRFLVRLRNDKVKGGSYQNSRVIYTLWWPTGVWARVAGPDGGIAGCALWNVPYLLASPDSPGTEDKPVDDGGAPPGGKRKVESVGSYTSVSSPVSTGVYMIRGEIRPKKRGTKRRTRKAGKTR